LANQFLPWKRVRCSPWPIGACHGDDEVEKKMVEGGEVEGEVEICVEENWWKNVWRKMKAYWRS